MNDTIQSRASKNTLVGILSFILNFIQNIILVPVLLFYWGNKTYGLWLSILATFTIIQTIDLGHHNYIGNQLNLLYHRDKKAFKLTLGSGVILAYILGFLELILLILFIWCGTLGKIFGVPDSNSTITISLIILTVVWFLLGSVSGILVRMLIPAGMFYQSVWWGILTRFLQFISLIVVAFIGGRILEAVTLYGFSQLLISMFLVFYIKKKLPEFYPWWELRDWKTSIANFKYSLVLTINGIIQQVSKSGLVLFIANLFSVAIVPVFTTIRTLTNTATNFTNLFISALVPDLVKYHAKGEGDKIIKTQNTNWFITGSLVNLGIIIIIPFIEILYRMWTKGQLEFNFQLFLFLAASVSLINFGTGLYTYIVSINDLFSQTVIVVSRVVLIFTFSILFIKYLGIAAIGLGILISEIFASVILPVFFVNKIVKSFSIRLSNKIILLSLLPPAVLLAISLIYLGGIEKIIFMSFIAFLFDVVIYIFVWQELDIGLRNMYKQTLQNIFFPNK